MPHDIPTPWKAFLEELDQLLSVDVSLYCFGGFVVTACYGLPRPTASLDVLLLSPSDVQAMVVTLAGQQSALHRKHGVYLDVVTVASCPDNYEQRLKAVFPSALHHLRLLAMDPYDLALAKLERNLQRDRDDVMFLAEVVPLDLAVLRTRYEQEMRPYSGRPDREDLTLELWIEMIEERRSDRHSRQGTGNEDAG
jgi:hypothetical protein